MFAIYLKLGKRFSFQIKPSHVNGYIQNQDRGKNQNFQQVMLVLRDTLPESFIFYLPNYSSIKILYTI